ncbi:SET and MYND domain-containing protein 4-like isoform X1 [Homarus americanus]|uniref:SET and MYND domain-containing protein 4-like 1 n=1 Tax=Homarus americanus TaxID=6706 RepID=A0A8J5MU37_HOMAM|nr:SET and MYND domain-containing protein 4-like isoform X1 [Homarus americanus]XP_042232560.1 SET and MYND domain-containing protein 4-like isoform X1 [Homarus americanus]XP_042232561.1 SET and MYND domain-containing protein 4-like isoform X1 [Homarus americanus]KAG7163084.1 SET and MYND domain-containing protein 4-like 1 [Homarus americanus]
MPYIDVMMSRLLKVLEKTNNIRKLVALHEPPHTTEEAFSFLWGLEEAHQVLTTVFHSSGKSENHAAAYRGQGDIAYMQHHLDEALKFYNLAISSAPHPGAEGRTPAHGSDTEENVNSFSSGEYKELAQAYEARSVVLYAMKQYGKCSNDVDLAFHFGCSRPSFKKLLDMKTKCQKFTSAGKQGTAKAFLDSNELSFAYETPKPPTLAKPNPAMPSLSSAVELAFTQCQGRHLLAKHDINPGEVVAVDEGYLSLVIPDQCKSYCTVCLTRCLAPLPCPSCNLVIFCSEECRTQGLSGYHWQECPVLPILTSNQSEIGITFKVLYRLMIKTSHAKVKEMIPLLQCEAKDKSPETLGFHKEGIYDVGDYRSVYHFVKKKKKQDVMDIIEHYIFAFIITKCLQQSGRYFINDNGETFTPSHEDLILTGSTVSHHLNCKLNNWDINISKINLDNCEDVSLELLGTGIYPAVSLLNHSCNPTCAAFYYGKTIVIRALKYIPAGTPITLNYLLIMKNVNVKIRWRVLREAFNFTCTCEACENNWPTQEELPPILFLKCVKCNKAINLQTRKCLECQLNYDEPELVAGRQRATPYNFNHISIKITKAKNDFGNAKKNILQNRIVTDEWLNAVRLLIKLLCKYVTQPCRLLCDAETILTVCLLRRSSCLYVRDHVTHECPVS